MSEFLKCDAAGCDHVEDVAEITVDMIGKPCPKCGANLLTDHDWQVYASVFKPAMQAAVDLGLARAADHDTPPEKRMVLNYHDGELRVKMPGKAGAQ